MSSSSLHVASFFGETATLATISVFASQLNCLPWTMSIVDEALHASSLGHSLETYARKVCLWPQPHDLGPQEQNEIVYYAYTWAAHRHESQQKAAEDELNNYRTTELQHILRDREPAYKGHFKSYDEALRFEKLYLFQESKQTQPRLTGGGGFPDSVDDQRQLVKRLVQAMFDFSKIIDNRKVRQADDGSVALAENGLNTHSRRVQELGSAPAECLAWKILMATREAQNGHVKVGQWSCGFKFDGYSSFTERFEAVISFLKISKAVVHSLTQADPLYRLVSAPQGELKRKRSNNRQNAMRDVQVKAGMEAFKNGDVKLDRNLCVSSKDGTAIAGPHPQTAQMDDDAKASIYKGITKHSPPKDSPEESAPEEDRPRKRARTEALSGDPAAPGELQVPGFDMAAGVPSEFEQAWLDVVPLGIPQSMAQGAHSMPEGVPPMNVADTSAGRGLLWSVHEQPSMSQGAAGMNYEEMPPIQDMVLLEMIGGPIDAQLFGLSANAAADPMFRGSSSDSLALPPLNDNQTRDGPGRNPPEALPEENTGVLEVVDTDGTVFVLDEDILGTEIEKHE